MIMTASELQAQAWLEHIRNQPFFCLQALTYRER